TPTRLAPGTIVMHVAASARGSVYSAAAPRIFGSSEVRGCAPPPVTRRARGGGRARRVVLARAAENLRLERGQGLRAPAGDDDDLRIQAVHDDPDHGAQGLARLVDNRGRHGVAARRGAAYDGH